MSALYSIPSQPSDAGPLDRVTEEAPLTWRDMAEEAREELQWAVRIAHDSPHEERRLVMASLAAAEDAITKAREMLMSHALLVEAK